MGGQGMYGLLPIVLVVAVVATAVAHMWVLAAILLAMAVFGFWLISQYSR